MKKFISILAVVIMCFGIVAPVGADEWQLTFSDKFNNGLFDVVAQITDLDAPDGADHGKAVDVQFDVMRDEQMANAGDKSIFSVYSVTLYSDGTRIREYITDFEGEYVIAEAATALYPAYLENAADNVYVITDRIFPKSAEEAETVDIYLVKRDGDNVIKELIGSEIWNYSEATTVQLCNAFVQDGQIVRTPKGDPVAEYDYRKMRGEYVSGKDFNDGLILKSGEGEYQDINGNCVFATGMLGYTFTGYNLGYYLINSNNGDSIDWSKENPELDRRYISEFKGIDNEEFNFENANINNFMDNGYNIMEVKDDAGNVTGYLIKLKNPAIVTTVLDGRKIYFDQLPVIEDGRTLVPLRAIFEALGAEVEWDGAASTVTAVKDDVEISLTIDSLTAYKNGEELALDVPARIISGRTLVPVRFVADCFGVGVEWDDSINQVVLTTN